METRPEFKEETQTESASSPCWRFSIEPDHHINALKLAGDDIALFVRTTLEIGEFRIFNANLLAFIGGYRIDGRYGLNLCPDGYMTAYQPQKVKNDGSIEEARDWFLVNPYAWEKIKDVEANAGHPWSVLQCAYPISDSRYIFRAYEPLKSGIKVHDAKTHEKTSTIKIFANTGDTSFDNRIMESATLLQNGKTALTFLSTGKIVLFRYAEEMLSGEQALSFTGLELDANQCKSEVFPVAEERFLTIMTDERRQHRGATLLQFWDSNTGERIDNPVRISYQFKKNVKKQMLLDGSILCCTEDNKICVIDAATLRPYYYDAGCEVVDMLVLATDQIALISASPLDDDHDDNELVHYDFRIIELSHVHNFKKTYIADKIMAAWRIFPINSEMQQSFSPHVVANFVAEYVGNDSDFNAYKHRFCGTFFMPPKSLDEKISASTKPYRFTVSQLIDLLSPHESAEDLVALHDLKKELEKTSVNPWDLESKLKMVCDKFSLLQSIVSNPENSKFIERLNQLRTKLKRLLPEDNVDADVRLLPDC